MSIESEIKMMLEEGMGIPDIQKLLIKNHNSIDLFDALADKYSKINSFVIKVENEEDKFEMCFDKWLYIQIERIDEERKLI